jgi:hypothetical protein
LTGGLGNQLFQLAAALSVLKDQPGTVFLDPYIGMPRTTKGKADILHLNLPDNITVLSKPASILTRKVSGYLLRHGISPSRLERCYLIRKFIRFAGQIILSYRYRKWLRLVIAEDVGNFDFQISRNTLLIGYFQSYRYVENITQTQLLTSLYPREICSKLSTLIERAIQEKPIFLHVRLTDYLSEQNFGNLGQDYYRRCINSSNADNKKIWVFSDDVSLARSKIPQEIANQLYFVEDTDLTPAQTWHLFRYGSGYIIANSSFSWWGAMAKFDSAGAVIAPSPWFSAMREPTDLIPLNWKREEAGF